MSKKRYRVIYREPPSLDLTEVDVEARSPKAAAESALGGPVTPGLASDLFECGPIVAVVKEM